ncbi:glycosyltransferase family 4 protein [Halanaerobaculum tunisiense]
MNVFFDYRMKDWSGIGRYCRNLIIEFGELDLHNNIFLLSNKATDSNFKNITCNSNVFSIKEQFELPFMSLNKNINVFHSPHFVYPIFSFDKLILTIHDLTPLLFPQYFSASERTYIKSMIWLAKFRADKIITVSQNTKQDLINEFNFNSDKIKVIYNGIDDSYKPIRNGLDTIKEKYKTGDKYILYVGNIKPHKNIPRLLKALSKVKNDNNMKLVIVGKRDKAYDQVFKVIDRYELEDNVIFTGFVPDNDLLLLYNAATLFVYPSLYEGFGLPPLEAMACGTPVITSNISSLPEVVGEAAITVDPYSIDDLATAINNVLSDSNLQEELSRKGLERVRQFSWRKTAQETFKVYQEVLKE